MHKTLHKKLTEKHVCPSDPDISDNGPEGFLDGAKWEARILHKAAKDLLQPRAEAVARLLDLARAL